ncbi:MAG: MFS transporter [Candidatus Heimdallarchaeota archaeon]|nr:MFS transporter [Candidatus Heimdallarchaeota archaeon]
MSYEEIHYSTWKDRYLGIQGYFYLTQGIAMGVILFFAEYMRSLGLSDSESLYWQGIISAPWAIKIIFGWVSDNYSIKSYGRRKPYIATAGFLSLIGWFTLDLHSTFNAIFVISAIFTSTAIAIADSTFDALGVDITPPRRHGSMQGVAWGARGLGMGISAYIAGPIVDSGEWKLLFYVPGLLSTTAIIAILLIKEVKIIEITRVPGSTYADVFSQKPVQWTILFNIFSGAALTIVALLQTFLNEDLEYSNTNVGQIMMFFALGMLIGSVILGVLGDILHIRITLPVTTGLYAITILLVFFVDLSIMSYAISYFFLVGFVNGGYEATQMRLSMQNSPKVLAGTMFNLYNSLSNLGQFVIGGLIIAALVGPLGYKLAWQMATVFLLLALIPAMIIATKFKQKELEDLLVMEDPMSKYEE